MAARGVAQCPGHSTGQGPEVGGAQVGGTERLSQVDGMLGEGGQRVCTCFSLGPQSLRAASFRHRLGSGLLVTWWRTFPQVVDRGLQKSLVFEDDLRFEIFFKRRLMNLMRDVEREDLDWDLM